MIVFVVVAVLAIAFAIDAALTLGILWVAAACGGPTLPFWPVFVGVLIVGLITGNGARS